MQGNDVSGTVGSSGVSANPDHYESHLIRFDLLAQFFRYITKLACFSGVPRSILLTGLQLSHVSYIYDIIHQVYIIMDDIIISASLERPLEVAARLETEHEYHPSSSFWFSPMFHCAASNSDEFTRLHCTIPASFALTAAPRPTPPPYTTYYLHNRGDIPLLDVACPSGEGAGPPTDCWVVPFLPPRA